MPLFQIKEKYTRPYKIKVILFVCEATCNAAKSQDCFQISAHVSLILEILVAHHFSKISPDLEM